MKHSTSSQATFGIAAMAGLAAMVAATTMARRARPRRVVAKTTHARRQALVSYLVDHLTGSDAAYRVVGRLRESEAGTPAGNLCADLYEEFTMERAIVGSTVHELGGRTTSPKRVAGNVAGGALQAVAGGAMGDLALFRTLEALAVGVQGKRLLWRALDSLSLPSSPRLRSFQDLEALAVDQWTRIERMRLSLACDTIGA